MSKHFATALAALLCLALAGCGGGGDGVSQTTHQQLQDELDAIKAQQMAEEEAARIKAAEEEAARIKAAEEAAAAAAAAEEEDDRIDTLTQLIATLTTTLADQADDDTADDTLVGADDDDDDTGAATTPVTTPPTTPPPPTTVQPPARTTPTTQTAEASQNAENLLAAFGTLGAEGTVIKPSQVTMRVPRKNSLTLEHSGYRNATLAGAGLRSVTMARTTGTGKTVFYTNRELSRTLLDHYGDHKLANGAQFQVTEAAVLTDTHLMDVTATTFPSHVTVTHGLRASLSPTAKTKDGEISTDADAIGSADTDDRMLSRTVDSISGSVHGVSGTFRCVEAGGAACKVTVTGSYADDVTDMTTTTENRLTTVAMTPADATLYFRPTSPTATVSLCADPVGCTAGDDEQYMVFGYWRRDPTGVGPYDFSTFAAPVPDPVAATVIPATGVVYPLFYGGKAVGAYVEKDPTATTDVYRQGEFVAAVSIKATTVDDIAGTVSGFTATPTGGSSAPRGASRWVVTLIDGGAVHLNVPGGGSITDTSADNTTTGAWAHKFVPAHDDAESDIPPAVVGAFDARTPDVSILGAFGAER